MKLPACSPEGSKSAASQRFFWTSRRAATRLSQFLKVGPLNEMRSTCAAKSPAQQSPLALLEGMHTEHSTAKARMPEPLKGYPDLFPSLRFCLETVHASLEWRYG